jgi:hypothetical protein
LAVIFISDEIFVKGLQDEINLKYKSPPAGVFCMHSACVYTLQYKAAYIFALLKYNYELLYFNKKRFIGRAYLIYTREFVFKVYNIKKFYCCYFISLSFKGAVLPRERVLFARRVCVYAVRVRGGFRVVYVVLKKIKKLFTLTCVRVYTLHKKR